jgi:hypothetical protein
MLGGETLDKTVKLLSGGELTTGNDQLRLAPDNLRFSGLDNGPTKHLTCSSKDVFKEQSSLSMSGDRGEP